MIQYTIVRRDLTNGRYYQIFLHFKDWDGLRDQ